MRVEVTVDGKVVKKNIPEIEIQRIMNGLHITQDEAVTMWLEDEGILYNEEQEALCQKSKENDIMRTIHDAESAKVTAKKMCGDTKRKRTVKPQPDKEEIISNIAEMLAQNGCTDIEIENKTKIVNFVYNSAPYKINLTATRTKKE